MTLPEGEVSEFSQRDGEVVLASDPAEAAPDAKLVFIGRIRSLWRSRDECPKNMAAARERGAVASIELDEAYRPGLMGLEAFSQVIVLTWLDRAPRNLIVQKPRHAVGPKGVYALRSPVRPNPVGLHVASILSVDITAGRITIDAIDVLDGTPVIDLKPYFASTDAFPSEPGDQSR